MATYTELVTKVKDWSNRSDISDAVVGDFLSIAQKKINNTLRIPPMEQLVQITVAADTREIAVPADMIDVIYIRTLNSDGATLNLYESKIDARSFLKKDMVGYGNYSYTRVGSNYRFNNEIAKDVVIEIYYYRVLPELNATYEIGTCTVDAVDTLSIPEVDCTGTWVMTGTEESPQWFRDEADEVLLYGALAELWSYYGDGESEQRWAMKFQMKMDELMKEENMRQNTGGTITANIQTGGLI